MCFVPTAAVEVGVVDSFVEYPVVPIVGSNPEVAVADSRNSVSSDSCMITPVGYPIMAAVFH